jgi:hypothetical protein
MAEVRAGHAAEMKAGHAAETEAEQGVERGAGQSAEVEARQWTEPNDLQILHYVHGTSSSFISGPHHAQPLIGMSYLDQEGPD